MRFKRGSRVEVMNKENEQLSWRCAQIISGKGHTYSVRYDCDPRSESEVVAKVYRSAVRPCPPIEEVEYWVAGDIVEVFNAFSWRIAEVLSVLTVDLYSVRLLGTYQEFKVWKSSIRTRQLWQDDRWVVIRKDSRSCGDVEAKKLSTPNRYQNTRCEMPRANMKMKPQARYDDLPIRDNAALEDFPIARAGNLKRASKYCSSHLKAPTGNVQKVRSIEKRGRRERLSATPLLEKVDAVTYPQENMGEYMHASFTNRYNGYNEMERVKLNGIVGCSLARNSESNDRDSDDASSVGSCSVSSENPYKFPSHFVGVRCKVTDTISSDAESSSGSGNEENCLFPPVEEVAETIHRLELDAYRCTLEALYASGPLSWEQEALLTNLRIMLHISNDEHLMDLKSLISLGSSNRVN